MNKVWGDMTLFEVLRSSQIEFGKDIVFLCSFSNEDMIILDSLCRNHIDMDIYTIDTGRLNPETYEFMDEVLKRYEIKINYLVPDNAELKIMLSQHGPQLFYESIEKRKLCCQIRKVDPLRTLLKEKRAWISGIRGTQTEERKTFKLRETKDSLTKINPLIDWTDEKVKTVIQSLKIHSNKLYMKGYKSIGCLPCTRPVFEGEGERDGRWWWENGSKECGIHTSNLGGTT
jgi:phosphoadenosine phosphosulfate reductase